VDHRLNRSTCPCRLSINRSRPSDQKLKKRGRLKLSAGDEPSVSSLGFDLRAAVESPSTADDGDRSLRCSGSGGRLGLIDGTGPAVEGPAQFVGHRVFGVLLRGGLLTA